MQFCATCGWVTLAAAIILWVLVALIYFSRADDERYLILCLVLELIIAIMAIYGVYVIAEAQNRNSLNAKLNTSLNVLSQSTTPVAASGLTSSEGIPLNTINPNLMLEPQDLQRGLTFPAV